MATTNQTEQAVTDGIIDISIAHSPDSDDAFMFYGLATNKIRVPGYRFSHTLCDIETLNRRAREEAFYDVSAISFHAYPYVQDNYTIMGCGGSVGEGYGPMIVSGRKLSLSDLDKALAALTLTNGQIVIGSTSNPPAAGTITAGSGISVQTEQIPSQFPRPEAA